MSKIVGMGNALVDVLVRLDDDSLLGELNLPKGSMQLIDRSKYHEIAGRLHKKERHLTTGGSAGNTILGLARLNAQVRFIGKVGADSYGRFLRNSLSENSIEDGLMTHHSLPSGIASTLISPDGERTFGTYLGAASSLKAEDLTPAMFEGHTHLYIEGYLVQNHGLIQKAMELAKEAGLQVCLDMASYNIVENDKDFFTFLINEYVDILFANEEEARVFTGKEPEEALDVLGEMCSIAIVKLGAKGSCVKNGDRVVKASAIPVEQVVDTTGAGDYYAAGFLYGLAGGLPLEKCAEIGSIVSGNVIKVVGAHMPDTLWNEIKLNIERVLSE